MNGQNYAQLCNTIWLTDTIEMRSNFQSLFDELVIKVTTIQRVNIIHFFVQKRLIDYPKNIIWQKIDATLLGKLILLLIKDLCVEKYAFDHEQDWKQVSDLNREFKYFFFANSIKSIIEWKQGQKKFKEFKLILICCKTKFKVSWKWLNPCGGGRTAAATEAAEAAMKYFGRL